MNVRVPVSDLEGLDRALVQAKAEGKLPVGWNRSDLIRAIVAQASEDLSFLDDYDDAE
jgi:hypothetical protein